MYDLDLIELGETCLLYRVNSRGVVKVADFGLTRELIARNRHRDPERGLAIIMRWMAVEVLEANTFSTMSDVVSPASSYTLTTFRSFINV